MMGKNLRFLAVFGLVVFLGCGGGEAVFGVSALADDFDLSISGDGDSGSSTSAWVNTGSQAEVSFSLGVGTTGQVKLTIRDDGGAQVYQGTISSEGQNSLDAVTSVGTPGGWEVKVEVSNLKGNASVSLTRFTG